MTGRMRIYSRISRTTPPISVWRVTILTKRIDSFKSGPLRRNMQVSRRGGEITHGETEEHAYRRGEFGFSIISKSLEANHFSANAINERGGVNLLAFTKRHAKQLF